MDASSSRHSLYLTEYYMKIVKMKLLKHRTSEFIWTLLICGNCYSCGDAMCTIAASTTFPEPFETPRDRRRLGWVHKSLSGTRCSDHVALLNAFQSWEEARYVSVVYKTHSCVRTELVNLVHKHYECKHPNVILFFFNYQARW